MSTFLDLLFLLLAEAVTICDGFKNAGESQLQAAGAIAVANAEISRTLTWRRAGSSASPPKLPRQWRAYLNQTYLVNGTAPQPTFGFAAPVPLMASDADERRTITFSDMKLPFAPNAYVGTAGEWFNSTVFNLDNSTFFNINGNSYFAGGNAPFSDLFAWVPVAQYEGDIIFGGQRLQRWTFSSQSPQMSSSSELLVQDSGLPVRVAQNISLPSVVYNVTSEFFDFQAGLGEIAKVLDSFNKTEYLTPRVCPAEEQPAATNVTMWIFHAKHVMDIQGQDLGDEAGDVVFVCQDVIANQSLATDHGYEWLTQWEIELVPRWGQYQNCNGHPPQCMGGENFWVGREHAEYLGVPAFDRQCGKSNELTGMWFSLPIGGQCKSDARPGDGSCTWRIAGRVKTIEGKCLFEQHGFKHACIEEQRSPFPTATQLFKDAFASEDPSKGGCPALPVNAGMDSFALVV
jgi:hypothetical protein